MAYNCNALVGSSKQLDRLSSGRMAPNKVERAFYCIYCKSTVLNSSFKNNIPRTCTGVIQNRRTIYGTQNHKS